MSVGKNHVVKPFNAASAALDDSQRLVKISRKNTVKTVAANGGVELESECVSVPILTLTDAQILSIREQVEGMVEKAQNGVVRELVDNGAVSVNDDQIGFDAICSYMVRESAGERLKKETIVAWWNSEVDGLFRAYIEPKFGIIAGGVPATDVQILKLQQTCNIYCDLFATVSGRGLVKEEHIGKLQNTLEKLELNDYTAKKISAKLGAMKAEHKAMADALGDCLAVMD